MLANGEPQVGPGRVQQHVPPITHGQGRGLAALRVTLWHSSCTLQLPCKNHPLPLLLSAKNESIFLRGCLLACLLFNVSFSRLFCRTFSGATCCVTTWRHRVARKGGDPRLRRRRRRGRRRRRRLALVCDALGLSVQHCTTVQSCRDAVDFNWKFFLKRKQPSGKENSCAC